MLRTLHDLKRVEIVWPTAPLSPSTLMALRRTCHVSIDEPISDELLAKIHEIPMVKRARRLKF